LARGIVYSIYCPEAAYFVCKWALLQRLLCWYTAGPVSSGMLAVLIATTKQLLQKLATDYGVPVPLDKVEELLF